MTTEFSKATKITSWVARIVVAVILLQTLFFKFTGAPESIYIFEKLGMEPMGRYLSGFAELVASILLLVPSTVAVGGVIALGVITGAIVAHLGPLGIEVMGDGGTLFGMALVVFAGAATAVWIHRRELPVIGSRFD